MSEFSKWFQPIWDEFNQNEGIKMDVFALKLISGEDVVSEIVETDDKSVYMLKDPIALAYMQDKEGRPQIGFAPFPMHSEQDRSGKKVAIDKRHVVYFYTPNEHLVSSYKNIFGKGIVLPPKKSLIME